MIVVTQPSMTDSIKEILTYLMVNQYIYKGRNSNIHRLQQNYGVGTGFVIYHKNKIIHTESIHMPDTSAVFQAEIETISHACQYALANLKDLDIKYIKILSDSQAAIRALEKPKITSQSVLAALDYMETLALSLIHI